MTSINRESRSGDARRDTGNSSPLAASDAGFRRVRASPYLSGPPGYVGIRLASLHARRHGPLGQPQPGAPGKAWLWPLLGHSERDRLAYWRLRAGADGP